MNNESLIPFTPKRALLSVSDKRGLVELAKKLHEQGVELVATGNTAALLNKNQIPVTDVSTCTQYPEMLDGRVKTLHPAIHAGLLARNNPEDEKTLAQQQISRFDLLIVNLYPFEQVISDLECSFEHAIENIDIGGPAMIRSAAKNHAHVYVVVTPDDYSYLGQCLLAKEAPAHWRFELAKKAFSHTAHYDSAIASYLENSNNTQETISFPPTLRYQFTKQYELRYGENPHQKAAFYAEKKPYPGSLAAAECLQGKQLSYNNLLDADAAFDCVKAFPIKTHACVIVKHSNPCGIALSDEQLTAYLRAFETDPNSAFGGILAFNQPLTAKTAQAILSKQFAELIIAPSVEEEAKVILATKPNIRVLCPGEWPKEASSAKDLRRISGGLLVQEHDNLLTLPQEWTTVTTLKPTAEQLDDLLFAWTAVKYVKSNAIVFAKNRATIGIGAGQTSRIMSTRIGLWQAEQAQFSTHGALMASDAFFPFADSIESAAKAGISAIVQPGGSMRDKEVIAAANHAEIAMVFTGYRHFKH